jgi:hypothetical protein
MLYRLFDFRKVSLYINLLETPFYKTFIKIYIKSKNICLVVSGYKKHLRQNNEI